jgi:hypothetical protein
MKHRILALILAAAGAAYGADWEFDHVVNAIENHYGVKRTHIPLMGIANLFVKVAHPAGARGFKLAVFEDLRASSAGGDTAELDRVMDEICRGGMHSLVVTHSRRDGESSYILTGEVGKSTKMLIATFERNEATVIEVQVDIATLLKTIGSPDEARRSYRADLRDRDER